MARGLRFLRKLHKHWARHGWTKFPDSVPNWAPEVNESLAAEGLRRPALEGLASNDPRKVRLARLVHQQTTISLGWIARG
jgi:hypothetical protein